MDTPNDHHCDDYEHKYAVFPGIESEEELEYKIDHNKDKEEVHKAVLLGGQDVVLTSIVLDAAIEVDEDGKVDKEEEDVPDEGLTNLRIVLVNGCCYIDHFQ